MKFEVSQPSDALYQPSVTGEDGVFRPSYDNYWVMLSDLKIDDQRGADLAEFARQVRSFNIDENSDVDREDLESTGEALVIIAILAAGRLPFGGDLRVSLAALATQGAGPFEPGGWPLKAEIYVVRVSQPYEPLRFVVLAKRHADGDHATWVFELNGRKLTHVADVK